MLRKKERKERGRKKEGEIGDIRKKEKARREMKTERRQKNKRERK